MNEDLFETLDKAGFGSNVHEVASEGECRVLRLDDDSGEGFMTMYRVFEGIYLMYNDFHLKSCNSEYQNAETVLCIDHCREGRIEHTNALGGHYYMEAAAAMLISESGITIAEISQRLGYDNASKFSAAFRDVMGTAPQNYRKRQEES